MRAIGVHRGRDRRREPRLADDRTRPCAAASEAFVIDSPVLPDELELLPALLEQAGFSVQRAAGDARRLGSPARPPGVPGQRRSASPRRRRRGCGPHPGEAQRALRDFDERHYVDAPGAAGARLGRGAAGARATAASATSELELHPADGHTVDGMAIWIPWARSSSAATTSRRSRSRRPRPRSTPTSRRSRGSSRSSRGPTYVVPGHGGPIERAQAARALLREDRAYLEALRAGGARRRRCRPDAATPSSAACTPQTSRGSAQPAPHEHVAPARARRAPCSTRRSRATRRGRSRRVLRSLVSSSIRRAPRARARSNASCTSARPTPLPRAGCSTYRSSSQQSGASRPDRVAEAQLADTAGRRARLGAAEQELGRRVGDQPRHRRRERVVAGLILSEPVAEGDQQPRDLAGLVARRARARPALTATRSRRACRPRRPRRRPRSAAPSTVPPLCAVISFSIFIASMTATSAPSSHRRAGLDGDLQHGPLHRAAQQRRRRRRRPACSPRVRAGPAPGLARARAGAPVRAARWADHAHVEAPPADLDRVVERDRRVGARAGAVGVGVGVRRAGADRRQPLVVLEQVAAGLAPRPLLGRQQALVEREQRRAGR